MTKQLLLFFILISIHISLFAQNIIDPQSIRVFEDSISFLSSLPPGQEGSEEEQSVFLYVENFVRSTGLEFEYEQLIDIEGQHSFSKNLIVRIPGQSSDQIIFAAAADSYEINSGRDLNIALLLAFMNENKKVVPPVGLTFLFTSGDRLERSYLGSSEFLYNYSFKNNAALLYLMLSQNDEIPEIYGSSVRKSAPGWFMEGLRSSFHKAGMESRIDSTALFINRAGLSINKLPISKFLDEDIPAAALISSGFNGPSISNNGNQYLLFLHNLVNLYDQGLPDNWDNNYVYIGKNRSILYYLSENFLVLSFILLLSAALVLPLFQERSIYLNYKKFRSQLWTVPIVIYLSFMFFMISTLMLEELILLLAHGTIWQEYPLYFFLLKIISVLFLSTLFINMLRGLPFPKNPHFYSYFAFIISFINMILVTILNISFSPVMLVSLIFVYFFVISRSKGGKRFFMILSVLPQLAVLLFLFSRDYISVYELALLSRVKGNWLLTFMALPLICMISSLGFYHHHYDKSRQEMMTALLTLLLALSMILMIYFSYQLEPFSTRFRQKMILDDRIDLDNQRREVTLESDGSIGNGTLIIDSNRIPFSQIGNVMRIQGEIAGHPLDISWTLEEFLDRRLINLSISSEYDPDEIKILISSDEPFVLYDCPFPYEIQPDLKSARIFIGINPPMPLNIPLIFSKNSKPDLTIQLNDNESSYKVDLENSLIQQSSRTTIIKTISFDKLIEGSLSGQ